MTRIHSTPHRGAGRARSGLLALAAATVALTGLAGCAPLLLGGAVVGTTMVVSDRRTTGTQIDDESIELKGAARAREIAGPMAHINVTSYNRTVLLTGEVPDEATRQRVEQTVAAVDNVRLMVNELAIAGASSVSSRSNDTVLTTKVKATFVDAKDLQAHAVKVVSERGIVYLMGKVTEREAARAADLARAVPGVLKVVRAFEVVTEGELSKI